MRQCRPAGPCARASDSYSAAATWFLALSLQSPPPTNEYRRDICRARLAQLALTQRVVARPSIKLRIFERRQDEIWPNVVAAHPVHVRVVTGDEAVLENGKRPISSTRRG